jgi:hypothetical protein
MAEPNETRPKMVRKRKGAKPEAPKEARERREMAEFALDPVESRLLAGLQTHLSSQYGEQRLRSRILRASCHHGLLVETILAGPDKSGLYAGRYTGKELAELTRQQALLLSDVQARYSTPILSAAPICPAAQPVPLGASPNAGEASTTTAEIDQSGAAAVKGLGVGLMKRDKPRPAPPE